MPSLAGMFASLMPTEVYQIDYEIHSYFRWAKWCSVSIEEADRILLEEFEKSKRSRTSMFDAVKIAQDRIKEPHK